MEQYIAKIQDRIVGAKLNYEVCKDIYQVITSAPKEEQASIFSKAAVMTREFLPEGDLSDASENDSCTSYCYNRQKRIEKDLRSLAAANPSKKACYEEILHKIASKKWAKDQNERTYAFTVVMFSELLLYYPLKAKCNTDTDFSQKQERLFSKDISQKIDYIINSDWISSPQKKAELIYMIDHCKSFEKKIELMALIIDKMQTKQLLLEISNNEYQEKLDLVYGFRDRLARARGTTYIEMVQQIIKAGRLEE